MAASRKNASNSSAWFTLPDNYIYISHLGDNGVYFILPNYPTSIQDTLGSSWSSETALSRSAPMYTYSNSGPRDIQITLDLTRDLMDSVNTGVSNANNPTEEEYAQQLYEKCTGLESLGIDKFNDYDDYLDKLLKCLQAIAVPKYNLSNKAVEPPLVAVRICNEIFVRGIVNGGVGLVYSGPILQNGKYSHVQVSFTVSEIDPYDATTIFKNGSFRGVTKTMKAGFHLED